MGAVRAFLKAVERLARNGDISIDDAYRFAKQQFGEVSDLMKLQINRLFKQKQASGIKKQKEGEVIDVSFKPGRDKKGNVVEESQSQKEMRELNENMKFFKKEIDKAKEEGISFSVPERGIFNQKTSIDEVTEMLTKNPFRPGGGLDPLEGMTRTAARVVLGRRGIKIPDRSDPIDVFEENFGGDALMDLKNVADELLEKETTGNITESMGKFLDDQGMFDLKIDKDAPKTMSDEELIKKITDDDPDRTNNAMGGINRTNFATGGIKLAGFLARKGKDLKEEIRRAINRFMQPSGDNKLDADVILDDMLDELGVDRDQFDQKDVIDAYGEIYDNLTAKTATTEFLRPSKKIDLPDDVDPRETILPTGDVVSKQLKVMRLAEQIQPGLFEKLNDTQLDIITKYGDMIDDNLLKQIVLDPDPNNQAAALATIEEAKIMLDKGMSVDEVLKVQGEALNRKKQAEGGLSYLMGM